MFMVVVLSLGFFISVLAKGQFAASQIALLVTFLPAFLLSGFLFSIDQMPIVLQWITRIIPARYYVSVLKKIFLKGTPTALLVRGPDSADAVRTGSGGACHAFIPQKTGVGRTNTMLSRMKQMIIKEFIQVFRDKRTRFILIGPPIVQMLIFGYAATYEIHHVPTVVLDFDHSQESRELISRFTSSPYFDVQRQLDDSRELGDLIERGKCDRRARDSCGIRAELAQG